MHTHLYINSAVDLFIDSVFMRTRHPSMPLSNVCMYIYIYIYIHPPWAHMFKKSNRSPLCLSCKSSNKTELRREAVAGVSFCPVWLRTHRDPLRIGKGTSKSFCASSRWWPSENAACIVVRLNQTSTGHVERSLAFGGCCGLDSRKRTVSP